MEAIKVIITIIQVISAIVLILIVMGQDGKESGLSAAIGGGNGAETFMSKNKANSMKSKLAKATKWVAVAFFVLSLALNMFIAAM